MLGGKPLFFFSRDFRGWKECYLIYNMCSYDWFGMLQLRLFTSYWFSPCSIFLWLLSSYRKDHEMIRVIIEN